MQCTIRKKTSCSGVGIHYNKPAIVSLLPAEENAGIIFKRLDVSGKNNVIPAIYKNINTGSLSTKIENSEGISVATIEHLMAAIISRGITNLIVEIDNIEVPIMDGGSEDFCFLLDSSGIEMQNTPRKALRLKKEIKVGDENAYIIARAADYTAVKFTADFDSKAIGRQEYTYVYGKTDFVKEIAPAKTIANLADVEMLKKAGMGLGGNLKNTLVFDKERVLNENHLYNKDDFVKHKVLDFMGDLALAGCDILAVFECFKSGHKLNHLLLREIFSSPNNYELL